MARGIHCQIATNDIVEELKNKGFKIISAVNILSNRSKEPLNLFMLSFQKEQDIKLVYSIKTIGYQTVKIEELRKASNRIVQCKNCQEFNHVCTYCHKNLSALSAWELIVVTSATSHLMLPKSVQIVMGPIQQITEDV